MSIETGSRVGPYTIGERVGEGGMGVVYRAHDTRLQREVAIKVLPPHFAGDPERLTRFQREAQVLASLNHAHIAQIYGLEQSGGSGCIVMELVEGETLAERLKRGPIPLDDALQVARQVEEALEAAHERGVIHRDLKPANIKLTPDGKVKVLDFGLAKAFASDPVDTDLSQSPTMVSGSVAGVVLGTAPYMAPEQARGRATDKRVDIWAFGCVVYEMITGVRPFEGEDVTELLGAIIHKEPAWDRIPVHLQPLVRCCLEKDPKRRLRDIGDARLLLESAPQVLIEKRRRPVLAWSLAAVFSTAALVLSILLLRDSAPPAETIRFQVPAPDKTDFDIYISLSPDGRRLAFIGAGSDRIPRLWVRDLGTAEARLLPGTERAQSPFWSPDSRLIGFSVGNQLKKIDPSGGPAQTLGAADSQIGSSAWSANGVIVFGRRGAGALQQVSAAGGVPVDVTVLSRERGDVFHSLPSFLPDGRTFVYFVNTGKAESNGIYVGSLDAKPQEQRSERLLATPFAAVFAKSPNRSDGHLLFLRETTLMAQPFDTSGLRLTGEPAPVAEQVATVNVYGVFSASSSGVLAFRTGRAGLVTPVLMDRSGRELKSLTSGPLERAQNPRLSPDGRRLALIVGPDLWAYDLEGRPPIKLTFCCAPLSPLWTRDGQRIIFERTLTPPAGAGGPPSNSLLSIPSDGSTGTPSTASPPGHFHPYSWSLDGRELIAVQYAGSPTATDVVSLVSDVNAKSQALVQTPAEEGREGLAVSPDGRWLAYSSNTTGSPEIWVRPYGRPGPPVRVSPNGGAEPLWAKSGRELFYLEGPRVMSVAVQTGAAFDFKPATLLFEGRHTRSSQPPSYDVTADGNFVMLRTAETAPAPINVVLNWSLPNAR